MYTTHALTRMQQRGIKQSVVEAILAWGQETQEKGAFIYKGTKRTARNMIDNGCQRVEAERVLGKYVVVCDGWIVTVCHAH